MRWRIYNTGAFWWVQPPLGRFDGTPRLFNTFEDARRHFIERTQGVR